MTKLRFSFTLSEQNLTSSVADGAGQVVELAVAGADSGSDSGLAGMVASRALDFLKFATGRTIVATKPKSPARKSAVNSATLDESGDFEALAGLSTKTKYLKIDCKAILSFSFFVTPLLMNSSTPPSRGLLSLLSAVFAMFLFAGIGLQGRADALAVDSELLLLVDVSQSGLNKNEFGTVLDGYASALSSPQVLNSIQSGTYGRIAVSLMLYGNASFQQVGIPWMSIGGAADAAQFAALAGNVSKPNAVGFPATSAAITAAAAAFGSETGGSSNGFESALQIIDVVAAVEPNAANRTADIAARNGAMASGVDLINSIALGNKAAAISAYYAANVVGSTVSALPATSTTSAINSGLATIFGTGLTGNVNAGVSAVPEPGAAMLVLLGACLMLRHRRRA
jgi:hypothetical protein